MTDLNFDSTTNSSLWNGIINIALLILAIQFPVLFLISGLCGIGLGLYYLINSYTNLSKDNLTDFEKVVYNFENFWGWLSVIIGVVSMIAFFYLNKTRSRT